MPCLGVTLVCPCVSNIVPTHTHCLPACLPALSARADNPCCSCLCPIIITIINCSAIVREVVGLGVDEEDRRRTWMGDAEEAARRGAINTARAIYGATLAAFPGKPSVWRAAAALEKSHGSREELDALLRKAVGYCPTAEVLWLMAAKERWLAGDVPGARAILAEAFAANPDSEDVWLAAFKLEFENDEPQRARALLAKARETDTASTARVWMKSAIVEREAGDVNSQRELLQEGLKRFPSEWQYHWQYKLQRDHQQQQCQPRKAFVHDHDPLNPVPAQESVAIS
jgi:predicted Zn-dependent protease